MMIGLDAAEPDLVERWIKIGSLPNMKKLRESGAYGRLESTAGWLSVSPWPTFYTSSYPSEHGIYYPFQWRSTEMNSRRPDKEWLPVTPFWHRFGENGPRAIVIDVPFTYLPEDVNGIEIHGYSTHEIFGPMGS
jgi:predicted AlkP superfamily phosphohydrolase/phosphomutase